MKFSRFRHVGNFCPTVSQVLTVVVGNRYEVLDPRGNSACYSELSSTWMKRGTEIVTPRGKHRGERKGANRALFSTAFLSKIPLPSFFNKICRSKFSKFLPLPLF